ncbi:hypothetical protein K435DRAFT_827117 [Dendrothele bispora CBS 962.96]|uniref:DUF6593 domain-containing protein n=1 Tax=Dendrothele bispora (strain CBS 962.96) TaxID=1314807 RepID=A0A4S8MKB7_DENBC|nr:hypothetical protein K435DRAFT_827117 [Dendrothele bispora CBS 962.96]
MTSSDFTLYFEFPDNDPENRTFKIHKLAQDSADASTEFYRFHHPVTGLKTGLTTFQRHNLKTDIFETAGQIDWLSNYNCTISFGIDEVHIRELRKMKKSSSKSRRFKAGGSEYKWKEEDKNLICVDSRGKTVATWTDKDKKLWVAGKLEPVLDRLVVSCFLNIWFLQHGQCSNMYNDISRLLVSWEA